MKNLFIAIEGIDGSGKSTQVKLLSQWLESEGHRVYSTFEPSDGLVGRMIRKVLKGEEKLDNRSIAGLFVADRIDHIVNDNNGLLQKLKEGYTVISDRYYFSSYAYHGVSMDMDWVIKANELCAQLLKPNVSIFIDVAPEMAMNRINSGRNQLELYENLENLTKVRNKYFEAFDKLKASENVNIVNGSETVESIADYIRQTVIKLL